MMSRKILGAAMAVALGASAGMAQAADTVDSDMAFRALASQVRHDAQGNVSREDVMSYVGAAFDRLDSEKKGTIKVVAAKGNRACGLARGWRYQPGASGAGC